MLTRSAPAIGISIFAVTTIRAICDYFRILFQPVTEADWQSHYVAPGASPIQMTTLAYGRALSDFLHSALRALEVGFGIALVLGVQGLPAHKWRPNRGRRLRMLLQRINRFGVQPSTPLGAASHMISGLRADPRPAVTE